MEKGLLNTIQKGPLGIFQILVGTGREVRLAFLHYLSTFSYLWLAPTVLYFLFNFLECMCSYILYKWYFGVNSRIANVKCLKTDTDPKKKGFPHSSYTDSWAVRCTEIPFHIFSRRAKNFQVWHCYFFLLTGDMFIWWHWSGYWARNYESWNSVLEGLYSPGVKFTTP